MSPVEVAAGAGGDEGSRRPASIASPCVGAGLWGSEVSRFIVGADREAAAFARCVVLDDLAAEVSTGTFSR
jgi:hypothetical protein